MFSIGVFSKINKITTKTLRHYESIGLLKPDYVDKYTKYRYYTTDQLPKIHKIITLKQMGLSLNDIKSIIDKPEEVEKILISKEIEICEAVTEIKEDTDILKFKELDAVKNAVCILHKGPYSTIGKSYPAIFKWIEENKYKVIDNPRESYIDGIWNKDSEEEWLTEVQIPIENIV